MHLIVTPYCFGAMMYSQRLDKKWRSLSTRCKQLESVSLSEMHNTVFRSFFFPFFLFLDNKCDIRYNEVSVMNNVGCGK